jgi:hypothetical protein
MINKLYILCLILTLFIRRRKQMLAEALMSRKQQTAQESAIFFTLAPNLFNVSPYLAFLCCSRFMCLFKSG